MASFYKNPKQYQYVVSRIEYFKFLGSKYSNRFHVKYHGSKYANRFHLKYHVSRSLIKYKQIQMYIDEILQIF